MLRGEALKLIDKKRMVHSLAVESEAEKLAIKWGADIEKCRLGAIFHDITKHIDIKGQKFLCEKYNIQMQAYPLMHAKTAAAICRYEYNMPEDICDSISYHTTARADMTLADKIIYIADYIEPNRKNVEKLRELAYINIDKALTLAIEMGIYELMEKKVPIHQDTIDALNFLYTNGD